MASYSPRPATDTDWSSTDSRIIDKTLAPSGRAHCVPVICASATQGRPGATRLVKQSQGHGITRLIYPRARQRMDADGRRDMGREMAARHRAQREVRRVLRGEV